MSIPVTFQMFIPGNYLKESSCESVAKGKTLAFLIMFYIILKFHLKIKISLLLVVLLYLHTWPCLGNNATSFPSKEFFLSLHGS